MHKLGIFRVKKLKKHLFFVKLCEKCQFLDIFCKKKSQKYCILVSVVTKLGLGVVSRQHFPRPGTPSCKLALNLLHKSIKTYRI